MTRWKTIVATLAGLVIVMTAATPANAQPVQPSAGEGLIHMTKRVCGSSDSWQDQAARNGLTAADNFWLYLGKIYDIQCDAQAGVQLPDPPPVVTAAWVNPVPGTCRPSGGGGQFGAPRSGYRHQGIDLGGIEGLPVGTHVLAAHDGIVVSRGYRGNAGNQLQVRSADGVWLVKYNHLNGFAVGEGETVRAGQLIGYMGETGNATGPHLHVEVWSGGSLQNPTTILPVRC